MYLFERRIMPEVAREIHDLYEEIVHAEKSWENPKNLIDLMSDLGYTYIDGDIIYTPLLQDEITVTREELLWFKNDLLNNIRGKNQTNSKGVNKFISKLFNGYQINDIREEDWSNSERITKFLSNYID